MLSIVKFSVTTRAKTGPGTIGRAGGCRRHDKESNHVSAGRRFPTLRMLMAASASKATPLTAYRTPPNGVWSPPETAKVSATSIPRENPLSWGGGARRAAVWLHLG